MAISEELSGTMNDGVNTVGGSTILDHNHPLYLHPSDGAGSMSVGLILTGMDNYTLWSRAMKGMCSISTYFTKLRDLWAEYDSILPPPPAAEYVEQLEYQRLLQFLVGLSDSFEQARSQILLMSILPSINKAYTMVVQDESRRMITGANYGNAGNIEPTALFTAQSGNKQRRNYSLECDFCHLKGHTRKDCYKLMKCEFCNKTGQLKDKCHKIVGYPPDFKPRGKANAALLSEQSQTTQVPSQQTSNGTVPAQFFTQDQYNQLLQLLSKSSIGDASAHMVGKCFCGNVELCENMEAHDKFSCLLEIQPQFRTWENANLQEDLLSGKAKGIGKEEEGLYVLSTSVGGKLNRAFAATSGAGKSPFEVLYGKQPSISHLRVLGYLCFATNLIKHDKFEPRAVRSVLLGYAAHQKGYRLLDLEHRVFFISRDVVFYEDVFPFQSLDIASSDFFLDSTPVPRQDVITDPAPMADYIHPTKGKSAGCCKYPLSEVITYDHIVPKYQSYLSQFSVEVEPVTYQEAVKDKRWVEAMKSEIKALEDNHT
ncbi:uncharacterized protein LOC142174332 [Nicotiana tabacum]|uniref:Uncharacterized protein LOC142174332 n=1 Tax=Nicotiana tabacum TaxID=4097 RepID=A0AC58TG92_TOBAC